MDNPFEKINPFNKDLIFRFKMLIKNKSKTELITIQKILNERLNEITILETTPKIIYQKACIKRSMY